MSPSPHCPPQQVSEAKPDRRIGRRLDRCPGYVLRQQCGRGCDGADLGTGWFLSYTRTSDGRLLLGGSKGIMEVHPEAFKVSDYAPPMLVSELRVNGQRQAATSGLQNGLLLDAAARSFSIEFAALDYSDPARLNYAYRLDGFDPDWISGGSSNRVARYTKLDPGSYMLRARATNRSGIWSPNELAINVQVLPAWWEQLWFRLLVIAASLGLIGAVVHLRTRRLRVNQQLLERKVEERTSELQTLTVALGWAWSTSSAIRRWRCSRRRARRWPTGRDRVVWSWHARPIWASGRPRPDAGLR